MGKPKTRIMKNSITQVSLFIIAFVALSFLMSYARPAAEEPKQYMLVGQPMIGKDWRGKLEAQVNEKIAAGWHPQGGLTFLDGQVEQPMAK